MPHRIHTAKAYPIKSPNGSTIILYGHENGVKIVWRGGRPFKATHARSAAPQKTNGAENAVILLDSDDEGPAVKTFEDKPEFEDDGEESDPLRPHSSILQTLDLHFGTDALHLALLPASVLKADGSSWRDLDPLKQKIVFTVAFADNSLRLITLPLTPTSPASKERPEFRGVFTTAHAGNGKWGETVVLLNGHQKPSDGVTMTADFGASSRDLIKQDSKSPTRAEVSIIVASHSRDVTGLLLLFRIPIKSPHPHIEPFQTIYLPSSAKSISFNPSLSAPRSSHLLVVEAAGVCRIYDYKLLVKTSDEDSLATEQGTWLLSLYTGFQNNKNDSQTGAHTGFGRKPIVDAQWVSAGGAVIVLLKDGEWAIWDIEGVGPSASQGLLGRQGVKGGSRSGYSLTGYIDGAAKTRSTGPPQITSSKFAPMTPSTRKSTEPFSGRRSEPVRGKISVVEVPSMSPSSPSQESVVFWLGETFTLISSLAKYWAANSGKPAGGLGNLFGSTPGASMIKLEGIDLQGERCSDVEQIVKPHSSTGLPSDVLILGEHRFTILSVGKQAREPQSQPTGRLALTEKAANGMELDVAGIDQALARMENGNSKRKVF